MRQIETHSFNLGVSAVLKIAEAASAAIRSAPGYRATRDEFAAEALMAMAEEGRALLIGEAGADPVSVDSPAPETSGNGGAAVAINASAS